MIRTVRATVALLLVIVGLAVQAAAVGLSFAGLGWRWPIVAADAAVALGAIALTRRAWPYAAGAVALAAWGHVGGHWIVFGIEALAQLALLLFLLTFRLKRLW